MFLEDVYEHALVNVVMDDFFKDDAILCIMSYSPMKFLEPILEFPL